MSIEENQAWNARTIRWVGNERYLETSPWGAQQYQVSAAEAHANGYLIVTGDS